MATEKKTVFLISKAQWTRPVKSQGKSILELYVGDQLMRTDTYPGNEPPTREQIISYIEKLGDGNYIVNERNFRFTVIDEVREALEDVKLLHSCVIM